MTRVLYDDEVYRLAYTDDGEEIPFEGSHVVDVPPRASEPAKEQEKQNEPAATKSSDDVLDSFGVDLFSGISDIPGVKGFFF